ncbi:MAG TPA: calcium-binding protein [Polyangiaceae bacterium]|nr:calcium-binding protein [Polyangiaceae bacterium]
MLGTCAAWAGVATWVSLALATGCGSKANDGAGAGGSAASASGGKGGKGGSSKGGTGGSGTGGSGTSGDAGSGDTTGEAGNGSGAQGGGTTPLDGTELDPGADGPGFDGVTLNGPELVRAVTGCDAFDPTSGTLALTLDAMTSAAIIRVSAGVVSVNSKACVAADGKTKATADAVKLITVTGGAEDDAVYVDGSGAYGKDLLAGNGFDIELGDGNDMLVILGSSDSDDIRLGADGDVTVCDFNGDLVPDVRASGPEMIVVSTGPMPDTIMGDGKDLGLAPVAVPMKLFGGGANDLLLGGAGNDEYNGGIGNDTMLAGRDPGGSDVFAGNDGEDFVDYAGRTAPITVTLAGGADDGEANEYDNVDSSVENVRGGDGDDVLTGGSADNKLWGGAGNDVIYGGDGDDFIYGGDGNDTLDGGNGDDFIYGDDGDDVLTGDAGDDLLDGGNGSNHLDGGDGDADICVPTASDTAVACEL